MADNQAKSEVQAAIDALDTHLEAQHRITHEGEIPIAVVPAGAKLEVLTNVLATQDERAAAPRARRGTANHLELTSFNAHVNRFKDGDSVVFADPTKGSLVAVFDYHRAGPPPKTGGGVDGEGPGAARWGRHRATYSCPHSKEWKLWVEHNEEEMTQDEFGDFIDANMKDLVTPDANGAINTDFASPTTILTAARKLTIVLEGQYKREFNETTGETNLICQTTHGPNSTKIPRAFGIGIPVYEGGDRWVVEVRVRFSLNGGHPKFLYSLHEIDRIEREAFLEVRTKVAKETSLPVFVGAPE